MRTPRKILLVQLPIPPAGLQPIHGNVPLAAGYLKLLARRRGLETDYDIEILPTSLANNCSDTGLVEEIMRREPWMVGFTCYLWNIERALWIARQLKERQPQVLVLLGGPEVTADNAWVLNDAAVDFAAIGEGEQTFVELLAELRTSEAPGNIAGLYVPGRPAPLFRQPLPNLNEVSSPYLEGILDAADERLLLLETIRGCIFKCKFCYYPKSYDKLYFLDEERLIANLRHGRERGAREVVLLDPTLNQRKDFSAFLQLLARCNPDHQFTYFGELRGEGINAESARLLRDANFHEVEIGLQSVDPLAQDLMDRKNNLKALERGARAMLDQGIKVKVDLIIGLPGDTVASVRRGIRYLRDTGLYDDVQVFNLAILPGTAFRQEAQMLGLQFQPRPPYYVLQTPTLQLQDFFDLMEEAQEVFEAEFDALPFPRLDFPVTYPPNTPIAHWVCNLDSVDSYAKNSPSSNSATSRSSRLPPREQRAQAFALWLQSSDFSENQTQAGRWINTILKDNPFTTLQVVLEPRAEPWRLSVRCLEYLLAVCQQSPTYLDQYYAVQPGRAMGAKRLVILLDRYQAPRCPADWLESIEEYATIIWRDPATGQFHEHDYESVVPQTP